MHPAKYFWGLRGLLYKSFLKHVGNLTYIGRPTFIEGRKGISIGSRTRIFPAIRMEAIGTGEISIGNNVAIEQNVHITSGGGTLIIGNDVTIAANTCITNIDHDYRVITSSVMNQDLIFSDTTIGDGTFIGFGAVIQAGTSIGKHCVIGSNAVVRGIFPDGSVIVGAPGKIVKRYNPETRTWEREI